jgi:predicted Zn finger-like uncharacterized protein
MEVRCNRCGTEYEFDDVLISERGTTVKCTNCGFQFKVFAAGLTSSVPERWVVRTIAGEEIAFGSLRELQRGIAERRVGPQDLLSRGNEQPRRLGLIAELEPFFIVQSSAPVGPIGRTLHGVAPERPSDPHFRPGEPPFRPSEPHFRPSDPQLRPTEPHAPPSAGPHAPASAAPQTLVDHRSFDSRHGNAAPTLRTTPLPEAAPRSSVVSTRARESESSRPLRSEPVHLSVERTNASPAQRAALERLSSTLPSGQAPAPTPWPPSGTPAMDLGEGELESGGARSRWIAALVVAGVAVLLALTVGRRYLTRAAQPEARTPATAVDPRVTELLSDGNRLLRDGDWDAARERLLKASALAERDGRVLSALARLEGLHADSAWLELRLVDPSATDRVQARKRELERRVVRAEQAADAALSELPKDIDAVRSRVDAYRMKGELAKARQHLSPIATASGDPTNAYVLAAIDLAEDAPVPATAIDRLRVAATAESPAGRAAVALVYALARAGRSADAESELAKIGNNSPLVSLVPELKAFVARAPVAAGSARPPTGKPAVSAAPAAAALPAAPAAGAKAAAGGPHKLLEQARNAAKSGNLPLAEELYYRILESVPGNSEALIGLGDVKRRKNDSKAAEELYERAASESGEGSEARRRAETRKAETSTEPAPTEDAAPKPEPSPAKPAPEPHIDTTDLPGSK